MAAFGANYPCFQPNGEQGVVVGKLVSANLTANLASGEQYADDGVAEQASEFVSGSIAMETDDMTDHAASTVYGAKVEDGIVIYNKDDVAPLGKLAYYKSMRRNGKNYYQAYLYPQARAAIGNDSAQTKGSSITFQSTQTTFTVFPDENGDWRKTKTFEDQASARAWCAQQCNIADYFTANITVSGGGVDKGVSPDGECYVQEGGSLTLTITGTPKAAYDNGTDISADISGGSYTLENMSADHELVFIF
ncbi:MAG: hypothetical protein KH334_02905 [Clostridiales bacterium]|nr:hypothetical protein [Clostridiales bacterium]